MWYQVLLIYNEAANVTKFFAPKQELFDRTRTVVFPVTQHNNSVSQWISPILAVSSQKNVYWLISCNNQLPVV